MKRLLCWKNRVTNFQFVEFEKFNMKCEIERMEIIYTFYFLPFLEKSDKKLLTFCYWRKRNEEWNNKRKKSGKGVMEEIACRIRF